MSNTMKMVYLSRCLHYSGWEIYWFEKNLQGDVVAVYSEAGVKLISYRYDAWGTCSTTYYNGGRDTNAVKNSLRYRGYYFDTDLGLYYLQSRYYDANTCRFISADDTDFLGANGDLISYNLFAYCSNNPVMYTDPTGYMSWWVIALIAIGVTTVVTSIGEAIAYNNAEEVYEEYKDVITIEDGVIHNSEQVEDLFDMWALSAYVRYYTDSGAQGSSYGLFVEWMSHNIGDSVGMSGGDEVNFGRTIVSDFESHHSLSDIGKPIVMNLIVLLTNPLIYTYDVVRTFV